MLADCCSSWSGAVLGLVAVLSCFVQLSYSAAAKSGRRTLRQTWAITAVWVCLFLVSLALPVSDAASWGWLGVYTLSPESNAGYGEYGVSESCDTTCANIGGACDSDGFQAVDVAAMATIAGGSNGGCGESSIIDLTGDGSAIHPWFCARCFISKAGTCAAKMNNVYHDCKRFCPCACPRGTYGGSTNTAPGCIECVSLSRRFLLPILPPR